MDKKLYFLYLRSNTSSQLFSRARGKQNRFSQNRAIQLVPQSKENLTMCVCGFSTKYMFVSLGHRLFGAVMVKIVDQQRSSRWYHKCQTVSFRFFHLSIFFLRWNSEKLPKFCNSGEKNLFFLIYCLVIKIRFKLWRVMYSRIATSYAISIHCFFYLFLSSALSRFLNVRFGMLQLSKIFYDIFFFNKEIIPICS